MDAIRRHLRGLVALGVRALRVVRRRRHTLPTGLRHRPGSRGPASGATVRHEGATERFGAELRAMRYMDVSPELISDIETELRWGLAWHEFERTMQDEIDKVFAPYLATLVDECEDFDDLRDLVGLSEPVPA